MADTTGSHPELPRGIRVMLRPTRGVTDDDAQVVFAGALVSFATFATETHVIAGTLAEASLIFRGRFQDRIRKAEMEEVKDLARLNGTIERTAEGVSFLAEEESDTPVGLVSAEPDLVEHIRTLTFEFEPKAFPNLKQPLKLDLSIPPELRYLEVMVELRVASETEAADTVNDVLDVLVTNRNPPAPSGVIHRFSY